MLDAQEDLLDEVGSLLLRKTLLFGNEVEELTSAKPIAKIFLKISKIWGTVVAQNTRTHD